MLTITTVRCRDRLQLDSSGGHVVNFVPGEERERPVGK